MCTCAGEAIAFWSKMKRKWEGPFSSFNRQFKLDLIVFPFILSKWVSKYLKNDLIIFPYSKIKGERCHGGGLF